VSTSAKKPIIGILGGIGSGKSAVAAEFAKLGCKVIDADQLAHSLLDEPEVQPQIISLLGEDILEPTGKISRNKVAGIVFADAEKLSSLNNIIHPLVLSRTEQLIERYNCQNDVKAIVLDMPLLIEVGWERHCDKLIFIDCDEQTRTKRMEKTGLFDKNKLKMRENFQISLDIKASIAENTIDNSSGYEALTKQVVEIFSEIID